MLPFHLQFTTRNSLFWAQTQKNWTLCYCVVLKKQPPKWTNIRRHEFGPRVLPILNMDIWTNILMVFTLLTTRWTARMTELLRSSYLKKIAIAVAKDIQFWRQAFPFLQQSRKSFLVWFEIAQALISPGHSITCRFLRCGSRSGII